MKVANTLWFTGPFGTIGIVLAYDENTGGPKAYIGPGAGLDSADDTALVSQMGAPFMPRAAQEIFDHFNPAKPKE